MARRRTDDNHAEIMRLFRELHCTVADTSSLGGGFPDLVVGLAGENFLVEVKDGAKSPSRRKLTPDEQRFHHLWAGSVAVVTSADDVIWLVNSARFNKKPPLT